MKKEILKQIKRDANANLKSVKEDVLEKVRIELSDFKLHNYGNEKEKWLAYFGYLVANEKGEIYFIRGIPNDYIVPNEIDDEIIKLKLANGGAIE